MSQEASKVAEQKAKKARQLEKEKRRQKGK